MVVHYTMRNIEGEFPDHSFAIFKQQMSMHYAMNLLIHSWVDLVWPGVCGDNQHPNQNAITAITTKLMIGWMVECDEGVVLNVCFNSDFLKCSVVKVVVSSLTLYDVDGAGISFIFNL